MLIGFLEGTVDGLRARDTSFRRPLLGLFPKIKKNHVSMQSTEALRLLCNPVTTYTCEAKSVSSLSVNLVL